MDFDEVVRKFVDDQEGIHHFGIVEATKLIAEHRSAFDEWLATREASIVAAELSAYARSQRAHRTHTRGARVFASTLAELDAGKIELTDVADRFRASYAINTAHDRKRLCDMTVDDLTFVADRLEGQASTLVMEAKLIRAIGRRLAAGQVVSDVWTPEMIAAMFKGRAA